MRTLIFLALQVAALGGGCYLLWRLRKSSASLFWGIAIALAAGLAVAQLIFVQPGTLFEDFPVYWSAGKAVLSSPDQLLPMLRLGVEGGFVNLPVIAYLFAPLSVLPLDLAGWLFFVLGLAAVVAAWRIAGELFQFDRLERAISLVVIGGFGPLWYSFREGNSSHFMLLTLLLALVALRKNQDVRAGLLLGVTGIIKPPLLLLCVYAAIRLRWGIVLGTALVILAGVLASFAIFGIEPNLVWYDTNIGTFAREPIAAGNTHSIASTLARLYLGPDVISIWEPVSIPSFVRVLGLGLTALLGLLAIWAAAPWRRWFVGAREFESDIALIVPLTLFVSTLSWTHYYSWLLLPAAWLWAQIRSAGATRLVQFAFAVVMLVCALAYVRGRPPEAAEPILHWLFAYLLLGGIALFALLLWARRRIAEAEPGSALREARAS